MIYARAILTFLICFGQLVAIALAAGFIPALWMIARKKRTRMLIYWTMLWLVCAGAACYGLPVGLQKWRTYLDAVKGRFNPIPMYMGYGIGVLGAFFFFPEPMRIAHNRLRTENGSRQEDEGHDRKRKRRRKKRRTND